MCKNARSRNLSESQSRAPTASDSAAVRVVRIVHRCAAAAVPERLSRNGIIAAVLSMSILFLTDNGIYTKNPD